MSTEEFDQAMDDAARWLGARLSRIVEEHNPFWVDTTTSNRRKQVERRAEVEAEVERTTEIVVEKGLVTEL